MNAPYTFIPLSEDVIFPDWADRISHDMPFSDGLSGEIAYEIEAETPIYIRNSNSISGESNLFFNHHLDESGKRRYFIPGTSLKGMVRSLVEALSFSKLTQLNKGRYSFRDMKDQVNYPLFTPAEAKKIRCGWLTMGEDGVCRIDDHGKFFRIGHDEIDANYGSDFVECFKDRGRATKGNSTINDDAKWGSFKYNKLQGRSLSSRFSIEERETMNVAHFNQYGDVEGTLVVTGQASVRKEDRNGKLSGKFYEFIFPNKSEGVFKLSDQIWKDFLFQAKDKDPNSISEDWKYWKERFNKGERVPVFFRVDPKNSREIMDFGLTMMYRLSYKNSIEDMVPQKHKDSRLDMPEAIFGYTRDKENLRGRVQFSHAFALGEPKDMALVEGVLASPKASYYPNYIEQSQGGKYNTYSDTVNLSGRKFYPVHSQGVKSVGQGNGNKKLMTSFYPLASGAKFRGKVRYHNLRPEELGLLLSALTFHNHSACRHTLGMAKGYGFGRVNITLNGVSQEMLNSSLRSFEALVLKSLNRELVNDLGFKYILASHIPSGSDDTLCYMSLEEYSKSKGANEILTPITSRIPDRKVVVKPLFTQAEMKEEDYKRQMEEAAREEAMFEQALLESQAAEAAKAAKAAEAAEAAKMARLNSGLSALGDVVSFKKGVDVIKRYLKDKKMESLEDSLHDELHSFVLRCVNNPHKDDKGEFAKSFDKGNYWRNITKWVGEDLSRVWYDEVLSILK